MDSNDGSQGGYQGCWNQYGYQGQPPRYQVPPPWFQQGMLQNLPNISIMHPGTIGPQGFYPAEIGSGSVQPDEEDTEEGLISPAQGRTGKRTSAGARTKQSNFSPDEDVNLVKSYLEIINDEIIANAQRREQMWLRILERYNLRRGQYPERTVRSLQSRWNTIKAEASKFTGFYADVLRENPSGMSDADKTTQAAANFSGIQKYQFCYLHCWAVLKDDPKWQDTPRRAIGKSAAGESVGEDINHGAENSSPTRSSEKRPMGRDQAKAAKKIANTSAGSSGSAEYATRMQEMSLQRMSFIQQEFERKNERFDSFRSHGQSLVHIEQEKFNFLREQYTKKQEEKERLDDERILAIDLDTLKPAQRVYYEDRQEEILQKIADRRKKRQGPAP